ncbi:MAG: hypothetical protein WDN46_07695 [Methylocella sp.]
MTQISRTPMDLKRERAFDLANADAGYFSHAEYAAKWSDHGQHRDLDRAPEMLASLYFIDEFLISMLLVAGVCLLIGWLS